MTNLERVYQTVKNDSHGLDAIYEDYLIDLIGTNGLYLLKKNKLLETCGKQYGRQLYVLCEWKES